MRARNVVLRDKLPRTSTRKWIQQFRGLVLHFEACLRNLKMSFGLADDFLPFFFRRKGEPAISLERKEIVEFGEFRLDVDVHTIERTERGRKGTLTEKAF